MLDSALARFPRALSRAVAALVLVAAPASAQAPTPLPATLLEAPRLGVVFKAGAAGHKTRDGWKDLVRDHRAAPELVVLDTLPASAAKNPAAPSLILVVAEAKSKASGPRTIEYGGGDGRTNRLRYQGATAHVRAKLFVLRDKPIEIGVFDQDFEDLEAPEKYRFVTGGSKENLVISPDGLLDYAIARAAAGGLAFACALDLWRERANLGERAMQLAPTESAAFWRRASVVTLDVGGTAPVPWHSLDRAALEVWKRAPAAAAQSPRPATECAWCANPPPQADRACTCSESSALRHALDVLVASTGRQESEEEKPDTPAVEMSLADLDPSRAAKWTTAVPLLEKRVEAEHAADLRRLTTRLRLGAKYVRGKRTYAILLARDPVTWSPSEPDLVRHASELLQAFPIGPDEDGAMFGGHDATRPSTALARWEPERNWYDIHGRKEWKGAPEGLEGIVVRALWDNARGVDSEPAR